MSPLPGLSKERLLLFVLIVIYRELIVCKAAVLPHFNFKNIYREPTMCKADTFQTFHFSRYLFST